MKKNNIKFLDMENEYLILVIWCAAVLIFYKILKYLSELFTTEYKKKDIDDFFDSYGGKSC